MIWYSRDSTSYTLQNAILAYVTTSAVWWEWKDKLIYKHSGKIMNSNSNKYNDDDDDDDDDDNDDNDDDDDDNDDDDETL